MESLFPKMAQSLLVREFTVCTTTRVGTSMMTPQQVTRILPSMDPENRHYSALLAGRHRYLSAGERAGRPIGQSGTRKGEIDGRPVNYDL